MIDSPVPINLYPNQTAGSVPRLAVIATAVGSVAVRMPLIFDTGSAGVTLYAPSIFPSTMVSDAGFVFTPGQTSFTYNGITVTNQQGSRSYGSTDLRAQNGNIGYAAVTFGDTQGQLTTSVMPVFLYFSITEVSTGAPIEVPSFQQGVFGVAATEGTITLGGSITPTGGYPACATDTTSTCLVVSPLKYLHYNAAVSSGFLLSPARIQTCDITMEGACAPAPMLMVGLNATLKAGFSTVSLNCPPTGYDGPGSIAGYPVCQKSIEDTTILVSGEVNGTLKGNVVFDTGTANMQIAVPLGSIFPATVPSGSTVTVSTSSGFNYAYTATTGDPLATIVNADFTGSSIVGIGYFTNHAFFIDNASGIEGWR